MSESFARIFARRRPAFGGAGVDTLAEGRYMASHYLYFRRKRGMTATAALEAARALPAAYVAGREYYGATAVWGAPYKHNRDTLRHCSDTAALGLRFIGTAKDMAGLRYNGWFTDSEDQSATLAGAVWALPGKRGVARLVYGYRELEGRNRETNEGSAILCVSDIVRQPMRGEFGNVDETNGGRDAARWADGLAESVAEEERDYRESYNVGRDAAEADNAALEARKALLGVLPEYRRLRRSGAFPAIRETAANAVAEYLETIREGRDKRDSSWRDCPSYAEDAWRAGFMDTARGNGFVRAVRLGFMRASDWQGAPESNPCYAEAR